MHDDRTKLLAQIKDDIFATMDEVSSALESGDRNRQLQAGPLLPPLIARYEQALTLFEAQDRDQIERTIGRSLTDLRRQANFLEKQVGGQKAVRAADAGAQPFILVRAPGRSILGTDAPPPRVRPKYTVGGEVESWCGKCKQMRTHHIFAVVDELPKQVICVMCKSRHGYRSQQPVVRGEEAKTTTTTTTHRNTVVNSEAKRQREQRQKLEDEIQASAEIREFDPRDNFKSGQVISHPKYGRGKIETVLKGSILVRFLDGLRQVSRQ